MADTFDEIPIEQVTEGDIVDGHGKTAKVVHLDRVTSADGAEAMLVTFETDDGATFDAQYPTGTPVRRFPEAKWGSAQSPTPHVQPGE
ncbi:hypothetical protein BH11ACT7_BH11ACT7_01890 [soil metagenome]